MCHKSIQPPKNKLGTADIKILSLCQLKKYIIEHVVLPTKPGKFHLNLYI